jgi:hypothetical protein
MLAITYTKKKNKVSQIGLTKINGKKNILAQNG